jgi:hypothetical protein
VIGRAVGAVPSASAPAGFGGDRSKRYRATTGIVARQVYGCASYWPRLAPAADEQWRDAASKETRGVDRFTDSSTDETA